MMTKQIESVNISSASRRRDNLFSILFLFSPQLHSCTLFSIRLVEILIILDCDLHQGRVATLQYLLDTVDNVSKLRVLHQGRERGGGGGTGGGLEEEVHERGEMAGDLTLLLC